MAVDRERVAAAVRELLCAIGEDPDRAEFRETPQCVADAYAEFFAGVGEDPLELLRDDVVQLAKKGELVVLRDIAFRSVCEHHLLPFLGVAHVAYVPAERIVGLGQIQMVVDSVASRPQLQERITEQIADVLDEGLSPHGVLVVVEAEHGCVNTRGGRLSRTTTTTVASRGTLMEGPVRADVFRMLHGS